MSAHDLTVKRCLVALCDIDKDQFMTAFWPAVYCLWYCGSYGFRRLQVELKRESFDKVASLLGTVDGPKHLHGLLLQLQQSGTISR